MSFHAWIRSATTKFKFNICIRDWRQIRERGDMPTQAHQAVAEAKQRMAEHAEAAAAAAEAAAAEARTGCEPCLPPKSAPVV